MVQAIVQFLIQALVLENQLTPETQYPRCLGYDVDPLLEKEVSTMETPFFFFQKCKKTVGVFGGLNKEVCSMKTPVFPKNTLGKGGVLEVPGEMSRWPRRRSEVSGDSEEPALLGHHRGWLGRHEWNLLEGRRAQRHAALPTPGGLGKNEDDPHQKGDVIFSGPSGSTYFWPRVSFGVVLNILPLPSILPRRPPVDGGIPATGKWLLPAFGVYLSRLGVGFGPSIAGLGV